MTANRIFVCFVIFLSLANLGFPAQAAQNPSSTPVTFRTDELTIKTSRGNRHFSIEIAETPEQQEFGLMFRKSLPKDYGMLFIWQQEANISMWMKNTLIPLDMLFIDRNGRIVHIAANAPPESLAIISAGQPVLAVMELAGGTAAADGIAVGDKVMHSYFKP